MYFQRNTEFLLPQTSFEKAAFYLRDGSWLNGDWIKMCSPLWGSLVRPAELRALGLIGDSGFGHVGSVGLKAERNHVIRSLFLQWLCFALTSVNCSYIFVPENGTPPFFSLWTSPKTVVKRQDWFWQKQKQGTFNNEHIIVDVLQQCVIAGQKPTTKHHKVDILLMWGVIRSSFSVKPLTVSHDVPKAVNHHHGRFTVYLTFTELG